MYLISVQVVATCFRRPWTSWTTMYVTSPKGTNDSLWSCIATTATHKPLPIPGFMLSGYIKASILAPLRAVDRKKANPPWLDANANFASYRHRVAPILISIQLNSFRIDQLYHLALISLWGGLAPIHGRINTHTDYGLLQAGTCLELGAHQFRSVLCLFSIFIRHAVTFDMRSWVIIDYIWLSCSSRSAS